MTDPSRGGVRPGETKSAVFSTPVELLPPVGPAFDWTGDAWESARRAAGFAAAIESNCQFDDHDPSGCPVATVARNAADRALSVARELAAQAGLGMDQEVQPSGTGSRGYLRPPGDHLAIPSPALVVERASREPAWTAAGRKGVASPPKPVPSAPSSVVVRA